MKTVGKTPHRFRYRFRVKIPRTDTVSEKYRYRWIRPKKPETVSEIPKNSETVFKPIHHNGRLQKECWQRYSEEQCAAGSEAHQTVNRTCPVPHEDNGANGRLLPNPNGWVMWQRTGQCPVRPSTTAIPNRHLVVGGYKYPQPPQHQASKHSEHCIQYKSNRLHSKTQSKRSIHSKFPNQL
jgi:hypothetical protein